MEIEEQFLEASQLIQKARFNETYRGNENYSTFLNDAFLFAGDVR
jgi:hypothetical protein